jgi:hypothetical protein
MSSIRSPDPDDGETFDAFAGRVMTGLVMRKTYINTAEIDTTVAA